MPFYEYYCKDCGESFEVMQSIKADPLTDCEVCEDGQVRRKIFPAGMIFKGDGFYSTTYRGGDYDQQAKKEAEGESSNSTKSESSSKAGSDSSSSSSASTE